MFNIVIAYPSGAVREKEVVTEKEARELLSRKWRKFDVGRADMDLYCLGYHPVGNEALGQMLHKVAGHHIPTWIPVRCLGA